jgi:hypothetical protein
MVALIARSDGEPDTGARSIRANTLNRRTRHVCTEFQINHAQRRQMQAHASARDGMAASMQAGAHDREAASQEDVEKCVVSVRIQADRTKDGNRQLIYITLAS